MIIYTIGISHDIIIMNSQRRFKYIKHHKILKTRTHLDLENVNVFNVSKALYHAIKMNLQ